jgi:class 3 adenylate cyclase
LEDSDPIADSFENTTVLFADIVGFTQWSSGREPTHVFRLLENICGAFDKAAKKRKVFKIQTIGDCYVAVTGLPMPQDDHAVIVARFANECMTQMNLVTHQLAATLGPETAELNLRVGLHSGPVTAGYVFWRRYSAAVLNFRRQHLFSRSFRFPTVISGYCEVRKARFQLFGDTVNTAARMESLGQAGRIQISESTY